MRINTPVTQIETTVPPNIFIYSRTDLQGRIVDLNQAFADISGYSRAEMLGQPHNMVRHPDMPVELFADMWRNLKANRPWRAVVKNRRKDGGFYWVVANVSPVRDKLQVVGYQSVRSTATRKQIDEAALAYADIQAGFVHLSIRDGHVVKIDRSEEPSDR